MSTQMHTLRQERKNQKAEAVYVTHGRMGEKEETSATLSHIVNKNDPDMGQFSSPLTQGTHDREVNFCFAKNKALGNVLCNCTHPSPS